MPLNTLSHDEINVCTVNLVEENDSGNVGGKKLETSPAVKALSEGNIQSYISELMQSGRFPDNKYTKRFLLKTPNEIEDLKRSKNYFSEEAWAVLEFSANNLSRNPDIKTLTTCFNYVNDLLGDTPQAREVSNIIAQFMLIDAQRVTDLGFNIPAMSSNQLEQLKSEKQKYCEELQKLLPNAINIETLSIKDIKTLVMKIKLDENLKTFYGKTDFSEVTNIN